MLQRFICIAVAACPLMAQQFHIDHVTVAGRNAEAMQKALRAAGIPSEYGGPHSNHATEMALASFPDGSYLELIAIQPKAEPPALAAHYWHKFLESDGGPCAWAIRPANFDSEIERLRKAGVAVTGPNKSSRKRPDGIESEWETAQIGPTNGGFFPFLIHDFTDRDIRAFPSGKPATQIWTGVVKVVIGVRDLDDAIAQYRRAYGLNAPQRQDDAEFGAKLAWFQGTPVVLASPLPPKSPLAPKSWLSARLDRFGDAPCAFLLGATGGITAGTAPSNWFGHSVFWASAEQLGWHLGFEAK
jgi:hypothetical protein